jgi:hypothetical protein
MYYRAMVKPAGSSEPPKPVTWSGDVYYTEDRGQLDGMLQHMRMHFRQNEYSVEEMEK